MKNIAMTVVVADVVWRHFRTVPDHRFGQRLESGLRVPVLALPPRCVPCGRRVGAAYGCVSGTGRRCVGDMADARRNSPRELHRGRACVGHPPHLAALSDHFHPYPGFLKERGSGLELGRAGGGV